MVLTLDIGSSSVKAAVAVNGRLVGKSARAEFATRHTGARVEVEPDAVMRAIREAIAALGPRAKRVELIALSNMAPSWIAMDARGRALTPIITHQDRRSIEAALAIEKILGKARHLGLAGNRPFPGGISSTTCAWFVKNEPALMRRADLIGHLNTFLHRQLTGQRITDPSNASFMGFYRTTTLRGWSDELCGAAGIKAHILPAVIDAGDVGGHLTPVGARAAGLTAGTPMLAGMVDTSAAMLLAGARPGQLTNSCGSTDVLALCTDAPRPHEKLLTRALGVGRLWTSVSTLAAAGSSLAWVKDMLFAEMDWRQFKNTCRRIARRGASATITFDPYLAGDRMSIEQRSAGFFGITLASSRQDMLAAVCDALAKASAARLDLLLDVNGVKPRPTVVLTGGAADRTIFHRDWPDRWRFRQEKDAVLRGLAMLED